MERGSGIPGGSSGSPGRTSTPVKTEVPQQTMSTTRLYVECPNCHTQYLIKKGALTYSSGAYIENVAGAPEWQRLLCPCRPDTPYKFKLSETTRLKLFSADETERTHILNHKKAPYPPHKPGGEKK